MCGSAKAPLPELPITGNDFYDGDLLFLCPRCSGTCGGYLLRGMISMTEIFSSCVPGAAERAADTLKKKGSVLLVPTETVYGLVCAWSDEQARRNIYAMKQRDAGKPFAAFVRSVAEAEKLCGKPLPSGAKRLAEQYMPGPLTLIVPDSHGGTFGFRMPDHPFITELLNSFGGPLASTSANLSGTPPALNVPDGLGSLASEPDMAVDGGPLPADSLASAIVLFSSDGSWKLIRAGAIPEEVIRKVCR